MLKVDLRELARGAVDTPGSLAGSDPLFASMDVAPAEPVVVTGRLQGAGPDQGYWQGKPVTRVAGECRRCLAPVSFPVEATVGALFSRAPGAADDPDTYLVPDDATAIDLTAALRDELFLSMPRYLQCRDDCRG